MAIAFSLLTPRDYDILQALDRCPLTVAQLLKLSATFTAPFGSKCRVRQRLQVLATKGYVRRFQFAVVGRGTLNYYTLSPAGFQTLYGLEEPLPHSRAFSAIAPGRLAHAQALAEFIVHTAVAAHGAGLRLTNFCRENSVPLTVGTQTLYPDCAFQLITADGRAYSFLVELDNATERVHSQRSLDSWERKLRLFEGYQDSCAQRFRVLVVTTGTAIRLQHILALAAQLARNPLRSLVYGSTLDGFLAATAPLAAPCFLDHGMRPIALIPHPRKPPRAFVRAVTAAVVSS